MENKREKRQENKTIYRFNMKGGHKKVKVFVFIFFITLNYEIIIEFSILLYNFYI